MCIASRFLTTYFRGGAGSADTPFDLDALDEEDEDDKPTAVMQVALAWSHITASTSSQEIDEALASCLAEQTTYHLKAGVLKNEGAPRDLEPTSLLERCQLLASCD